MGEVIRYPPLGLFLLVVLVASSSTCDITVRSPSGHFCRNLGTSCTIGTFTLTDQTFGNAPVYKALNYDGDYIYLFRRNEGVAGQSIRWYWMIADTISIYVSPFAMAASSVDTPELIPSTALWCTCAACKKSAASGNCEGRLTLACASSSNGIHVRGSFYITRWGIIVIVIGSIVGIGLCIWRYRRQTQRKEQSSSPVPMAVPMANIAQPVPMANIPTLQPNGNIPTLQPNFILSTQQIVLNVPANVRVAPEP